MPAGEGKGNYGGIASLWDDLNGIDCASALVI